MAASLPAGELISTIAQHERSAAWHPHCADKAEECAQLLVQRQRESCRHQCGCVDGVGATYQYRLTHEAKHSKHPQCAARGLECANLLSAVDDRIARMARQAEEERQAADGGSVDEDEPSEVEVGEDDSEDDGHTDTEAGATSAAASEPSGRWVCPHVCGSCRSPGYIFSAGKGLRQHIVKEVLHPACREAALPCSALLRQPTPTPQPFRFPCRHTCGCVLGDGTLINNRLRHEKLSSKHPHCREKGMECSNRLAPPPTDQQQHDKQRAADEAEEEQQPSKRQRHQLALLSARLEVGDWTLPCLHHTRRCNVSCTMRCATAEEAVRHAAEAHNDCECGGGKRKSWMKRAELKIARKEKKNRHKQDKKRQAKSSKKRNKHSHDDTIHSDHSTPSSSHSLSPALHASSPYSAPTLFTPTNHLPGVIPLQPLQPPPLPSLSISPLPGDSSPFLPLSPPVPVTLGGLGLVSRLRSPPLSGASFSTMGGVSPFLYSYPGDAPVRSGGMMERFGVVALPA